MQGGVKSLDLSFLIILQEMHSNLKTVLSHSWLQKQLGKFFLSEGLTEYVLCVKDHTKKRMYKHAWPQTGHLAISRCPLGSAISSCHAPSAQAHKGLSPTLLVNSTGEGLCCLYLCIIQNRCSRNETGPQGEGKRRGEKRCWVGSWRLEKVTDFLCKKSVLKNTRFGVM